MGEPIKVSDETFEEQVINSDLPVMVDFWAVWCGPCKQIAPSVEALSKEYEGRAKIAKMDVDQNPQTSIKFNVRSIPTLLFFKGGAPVDQLIGAVDKATIEKHLQKLVG